VDARNAKVARITSQGPVKVDGHHGPDELRQLWFTLSRKGRRENRLEEPPAFTLDGELLARPASPTGTPRREPNWDFVRAAAEERLKLGVAPGSETGNAFLIRRRGWPTVFPKQ
jgi:hypothetical protein